MAQSKPTVDNQTLPGGFEPCLRTLKPLDHRMRCQYDKVEKSPNFVLGGLLDIPPSFDLQNLENHVQGGLKVAGCRKFSFIAGNNCFWAYGLHTVKARLWECNQCNASISAQNKLNA